MNNRSTLYSLAGAVATALLITLLVQGLGRIFGTEDNRIFTLLGYNLSTGGFIQTGLYFLFFWGIGELVMRWWYFLREEAAIDGTLLSEEEQFVYYEEEVNEVKLLAIGMIEKEPSLLAELVKRAATKYIRSGSVSEMMEIVSSQIRIYSGELESRQSWVRYTIWALPALGFIGTVWGISRALGMADAMVHGGEISMVTGTLGVAFDTTFMALVLSMILMAFYHYLQEKSERYFLHLEAYILENFVNRIEREE